MLIRFNTVLITILISLSLYAQEINIQESDPKAIQIANKVLDALGGKENWDNTHYICWNFFGRRLHIWDKWSGDLRFEKDNLIVLMNLNTHTGQAWVNGEEITQPDSLKKKLDNTYAYWINDSYWMFMPYKLKDPGVNLKYIGEGTTLKGVTADILQLTFENVGLTPQNKYHVYVDKKSKLVNQFDYFRNASDEKPKIQAPWKNWKQYGNILLSDDRGENRKMTDVAVIDFLPDWVFKNPERVDLDDLIKNNHGN
jgi:hypothetical protein